jgi:tetratricopeptide (TPR) repeat protein
VKRQQLFLVIGGIVLFVGLFYFGKTVNPNKKTATATAATPAEDSHNHIETNDLLARAKQMLSPARVQYLTGLENSIVRGDIGEQKLHLYHQLARFWKDSVPVSELYAYYTAEAAKLDNSEKSLTFAAHLFVDNLLAEGDPDLQHWLAENAKVLLDRALEINPNNDSSKVALGACYIFGNISKDPMNMGLRPVMLVLEKDPANMYAQLVLALGGKMSRQFDKAIGRFNIILSKQPNNLEVMWHLAECYEQRGSEGDKEKAIKLYETVRDIIPNPEAKKELNNRINQLRS